jgi:hypothetical protein
MEYIDRMLDIFLNQADALHVALAVALLKVYRDKSKCEDGRLDDQRSHLSMILSLTKNIEVLPDA